MRGKCGRRAGAVVICLFTGWAALGAEAAIIREETPFAMPPSPPAIPEGEPGLASGSVEPAPIAARARLASLAPLPGGSKPIASTLLISSGDRTPASASAPKLNVAQADDGQVGPVGQVVEVPIVPEPSTGVLLCAVGLAALARRGRRSLPTR